MKKLSIHHPAFTLVELLVVIGIIALLCGILLPTISRSMGQARQVQCASNMRQAAQGIFVYAAENKNRFPPNVTVPPPGQLWYDRSTVGAILAPSGFAKGGVLACPEDENALTSYAMNLWTSCSVDSFYLSLVPQAGRLWGQPPAQSSKVILLVEGWRGSGSDNGGWYAFPFVGARGSHPGQRFGGQGGLPLWNVPKIGPVNCEIAFERHRPRNSPGAGHEAIGAANFAYADGHVELKHSWMLVDQQTGRSTLDSLWSPLDWEQNK